MKTWTPSKTPGAAAGRLIATMRKKQTTQAAARKTAEDAKLATRRLWYRQGDME